MIRKLKSLAFLMALSTACMGQTSGSAQTNTAAANGGGQTASANSQGTVQAVLTKSVDAKKAKQGDKVEAKTLQEATVNGTALPKGTKLLGHVDEAKARTKDGGDSTLAIAFDNAILKSGQSVPFQAVIVAAAAPVVSAPMPDAGMDAGGSTTSMDRNGPSGGGALGGVGSTAGGAISSTGQTVDRVGRDVGNTVGGVANSTGGINAKGNVGAATQGSMGIPGVTLSAAAANQTNGSVFTSNSKNVKLDSGSTLVLRVKSQ